MNFLSEQEKLRAISQFNDDFHKMQSMLSRGALGIPKGVYRFKTQEEADAQVNVYIMKTALKR